MGDIFHEILFFGVDSPSLFLSTMMIKAQSDAKMMMESTKTFNFYKRYKEIENLTVGNRTTLGMIMK